MNFNTLVNMRRGYTFAFDNPSITSIKRSPPEYDACLHEHQYNEMYILTHETHVHFHFAIFKNGVYKDCKWKMEKETYNIMVYIKNKSECYWERYVPGEFVIKIKNQN